MFLPNVVLFLDIPTLLAMIKIAWSKYTYIACNICITIIITIIYSDVFMCICMYACIYNFYIFSPDNSFSVNNFFLLHTHPTLSNMADISQSPHHTNTHVYKYQSCICHMTNIQYKTNTLTNSAYFTRPTVRQQWARSK